MQDLTSQLSYAHLLLMEWYQRHGRTDLPWRITNDPYAIWVSEIMLQQTQVATVLERYYHPFLERFPTVTALAEAPLEQVLKAWEGLGYYTRARNLHKAAQMTAPALPNTIEGLLALPGIGRNTAHAIAAFAYRQPVAVMEANVRRILHRLAARERLSDKETWALAAQLVDHSDPHSYNQAMMDVGALICTPRTPACPACPLATLCKGKETPEQFPAPKKAKTTPVRERTIVVAEDIDGKLYLAPRTTRFLGGLFGFPEHDLRQKEFTFERQHYAVDDLPLLGGIEQAYSHFKLKGSVRYLAHPSQGMDSHWHRLSAIQSLPRSRADDKALALFHAYKESQA